MIGLIIFAIIIVAGILIEAIPYRCPNCGGKLHGNGIVYKCKKCGKVFE